MNRNGTDHSGLDLKSIITLQNAAQAFLQENHTELFSVFPESPGLCQADKKNNQHSRDKENSLR